MGGTAADETAEGSSSVDVEALDSLHVLPLSIIPLETPGLKKASMIKNARLESVIELFKDGASGSGQVSPSNIADFFQDEDGRLGRDTGILDALIPTALIIDLKSPNLSFRWT